MDHEYDWQNDGGIFIPENDSGHALAEEIDDIFRHTGSSLEQYMKRYYPDPKMDIVPSKLSLKEKFALGAFIGVAAVGGVTGFFYIASQFMESVKYTH
jgi:hypothetical protein